ncbi:MAG: hypothetical protein CVV03_01300 [Firmicutes bacterium HGW-Firmicutes-8]|nr:MAG: hypothetical protein CVV03_01300 [Firmicutes bacterium HGW-Firmicutes-8]
MRLIAHVFVRNFFITAAWTDHPDLVGIPLAVIRKNRVSDVSPEAAAGGAFPGMTKRHALQACPGLKLVDFMAHAYRSKTAALAGHCYDLSPRVEAAAENEAFIDLSGSKPPTVQILRGLAGNIVPSLGSSTVISLAPCRLLAKAATCIWLSAALCAHAPTPAVPVIITKGYDNFHLCVVKNETAGMFASRLPVEVMWPLEGAVIKRLKALGLKTFGDITGIPPVMLRQQFGSQAPVIIGYSRGLDETNIPVFRPPDKVIYHACCEGADRTQLAELLKQAAVYTAKTLQARGESCRQLTLAVFLADCRTETKTSSFTRGKHEIRSIYYDSLNLLNRARIDGEVTEISLAAGELVPNRHSQLALFEDPGTLNSKAADHREKLAGLCRDLAVKYAPGVIAMGKALPTSRREQMLMFVDPFRYD